MASKGERFLKGLFAVANPMMKARVQALIDYEEQDKEQKALERQAKIDAQNSQYREAQMAELNRQNQPKEPSSVGDYEFNLLQTDPEKYYEYKKRVADATRAPEKADEPKVTVSPKGWSATGVPPEKAKQFAIENNLPWNTMQDEEKGLTAYQKAELHKEAGKMASFRFANDEGTIPDPLYGKADSLYKSWTEQTEQVPAETKPGGMMGSFMDKLQTAAPQVQAPVQQPKPTGTFHGAETYEDAVQGIQNNFTGAEAEQLLQQAKQFFGVQ